MAKRKGGIVDALAVLNLSYASGRDMLYGVLQHVRGRRGWRLHLVNSADVDALDKILQALAAGLDGMLVSGAGEGRLAAFPENAGVPTVFVGSAGRGLKRQGRSVLVRNDDEAIGRAGAAYLSSLGRFASRAFVSRRIGGHNVVPDRREAGFRAFFAARDAAVSTYCTPFGTDLGSAADVAAMGSFLSALPKPAAVMAETDLRAMDVIKAAAAAGLRIPKDVALLGVDNDELLCETSEPALTSVAPDHVRLGELAAATLGKLMSGARKSPEDVLSSAKTIVERRSARPVAPATRLVERARAFISRHATEGVGAADVVAHLGVSRRLADARFRELTGESILGAILRTRLEAVRRKLRTTDVPIAKITAECGFNGENYAKKLFRARFGMSMREYRAKATHAGASRSRHA